MPSLPGAPDTWRDPLSVDVRGARLHMLSNVRLNVESWRPLALESVNALFGAVCVSICLAGQRQGRSGPAQTRQPQT